ncbi:hypothetical protein ACGFIG_09380 [Micromonospora sp. NPDC049048]|uniref:hypothetical protein n=1 Tax=Micromonospora sp. NPDC049048 TaxID=3364263 RepID=UPI003721A9EC
MNATLLAPPALPRDADGHECGTADMLAARLTTPERTITAARVRDWARRSRNPDDRLHGMLPGRHIPGPRTGNTVYRLIDAARCARATGQRPCMITH